ncbi:MAG: hypothetical protein LC732_09260, partial [Acidobacteria bacterium]|nr:hypothetical protein [Acidobacteriota bacterium]
AVGLSTSVGPLGFTIDKTPPALAFTGYADAEVIATPRIAIAGVADDAVTVTVNGIEAHIDLEQRTFLSNELVLLEGANAIEAIGTDRAGNLTTISISLTLDSRAPELTLLSPAPGSCTSAPSIVISGTYADPHITAIAIVAGGSSIPATLDTAARTWSATLAPAEGRLAIVVEASDSVGHTSVHPFDLLVDRTAPAIEIAVDGAPAADGMIANRPLAFFAAARDLDPNAALELRLDGNPYASSTPVTAEGAHTLVANATDCAGNQAQRTISFTIDRTSPVFGAFNPPLDATVGEMPSSLSGAVTDALSGAVSVSIAGTALTAVPVNNSFTLVGVPFAEGLNRFLLRAADAAGNVADTEYRLTVSTRAPSIEILESGAPLAAGSLFNREIRPEIRVSDPEATVSVTLDAQPFVSGTPISAEGPHTLRATATDVLGHTSSAEVSFTIDRTAPAIAIASPAPGAVSGDSIAVTGTAGDAQSVTVNGVPAALDAGSFSATVALEEGENLIVATGRDAAGNSGRAEVLVTRDSLASGIILTHPADGTVTNRPAIRVTGRVLSPSLVQSLTVGATSVPVDPAGNFVLDAFSLAEGSNAITATAVSTTGRSSAVTVNVIADRMPPRLRILERGAPMPDQ